MTIPSSSYLVNQHVELKGSTLELDKIFRPEDFTNMQCCIPLLRTRLEHSLDYYKVLKNRTAQQANVNQALLKEWTKIVLGLESLRDEVKSLKIK